MINNTQQWADEVRKLVEEGKSLNEAMSIVKVMMEKQESQLNKMVREIHDNAVKHGFWEDYLNIKNEGRISEIFGFDNAKKHNEMMLNNAIGNRLMLIVGEASETHEDLRKGNMEHLGEEIADIIIRCFDLCGGLDIDIQEEIYRKIEVNKSRPYKHGKAF